MEPRISNLVAWPDDSIQFGAPYTLAHLPASCVSSGFEDSEHSEHVPNTKVQGTSCRQPGRHRAASLPRVEGADPITNPPKMVLGPQPPVCAVHPPDVEFQKVGAILIWTCAEGWS